MFYTKENGGQKVVADPINELYQKALGASHGQVGYVTSQSAKVALEGFSADNGVRERQIGDVINDTQGLKTALESMRDYFQHFTAKTEKTATGFSDAQMEAGLGAALMFGTDPKAYANRSSQGLAKVAIENFRISPESDVRINPVGESMNRLAMESFDNSDIRAMAAYTVVCNMCSAQQDDFGEAFFPTVTIPPDQVGFSISVRLMHVINQINTRHSSNGTPSNWAPRNLIEAPIDSTILNQFGNKLVPVYRTGNPDNVANFNSDIGKFTVKLEDKTDRDTGALVFNKKVDILGLSQSDVSLANGTNDSTDVLDQQASLRYVYLKTVNGGKTDIVRLDVSRHFSNNFVPAQQGLARMMALNFGTKSAVVLPTSRRFLDDTDFADANSGLGALKTGKLAVTFDLIVKGDLNIEEGWVELQSPTLRVNGVRNTDTGEDLAFAANGQPGYAAAQLFTTAQIIGYTLDAQKTVSNFREIDQMIVTRNHTEINQLGLKMPIIVQRPMNDGNFEDTSDLAALIQASRSMASNAAVTELLKAADYLNYVSATTNVLRPSDVGGITRMLLPKPYFKRQVFDVATQINSTRSHERSEDVRAAIVNKVRDEVFAMLRDSGYKAMADAMSGGPSKPPLIIIGTDQYTYRHLLVPGDFRLIADNIEVKLVYSQDQRMAGKIIITLGDPDGIGSNQPNPKHFGNMAFKPELVGQLQLTRNGSTHKQLYVQPCFRHIVHMPIMSVIDLQNLPDAVAAKVAINYHQV